ncbi:hypothetical protein HNY73_009120 [Argiope bruennichi]|uniref:Uncharacterized protein n=1 Tax=Argiope bruennichi TaxID=94029 RepID=A0A8T0F8L4_ARGBR|nr:hypothetical protein HNY73_009120 [Argiope bruennichi]
MNYDPKRRMKNVTGKSNSTCARRLVTRKIRMEYSSSLHTCDRITTLNESNTLVTLCFNCCKSWGRAVMDTLCLTKSQREKKSQGVNLGITYASRQCPEIASPTVRRCNWPLTNAVQKYFQRWQVTIFWSVQQHRMLSLSWIFDFNDDDDEHFLFVTFSGDFVFGKIFTVAR